MQIQPIHLTMACLLSVLGTPALAQTSTVRLSDGTVVHSDRTGGATVRVNGQVSNTAAGPGAVSETHIGSRSSTVRGKAGQTSVTTIEEEGTRTQVTTTQAPPAAMAGASRSTAAHDYVNADLSGRNFSHAKLAGRKFTNVDLSGANLQGADLRNAEFVNVELTGANLSGADLTGARLVNTDVSDAVTTGTIWNGRR